MYDNIDMTTDDCSVNIIDSLFIYMYMVETVRLFNIRVNTGDMDPQISCDIEPKFRHTQQVGTLPPMRVEYIPPEWG